LLKKFRNDVYRIQKSDLLFLEFFFKHFCSFFESYYKNYEHYIEIFFAHGSVETIFTEYARQHTKDQTKEHKDMMKKLYILRNDAMLNSFNCSQQSVYKNYEFCIKQLKQEKIFDKEEWNEFIDHIVNHKNIKKKPKLMKKIAIYRY